jgi:hypothetical protein
VIVEFLAEYLSGELTAKSDVEQARWMKRADINHVETTDATITMLDRAIKMRTL